MGIKKKPPIGVSIEGNHNITSLEDIVQANADGSSSIGIAELLKVIDEEGITTLQKLVMRVNPVLQNLVTVNTGSVELGDGHVVVDFDRYAIEVDGKPCRLAVRPFQYAAALARHPDVVLTRSRLLTEVYGDDSVDINNVHLNMGYVRRALGEPYGDPARGAFRTVRGAGYVAVRDLGSRLHYTS